MNLRNISWFLTLIFFVYLSCKTTKVYSPKLEIVKSQNYEFVPMNKLMEQTSKYHGHYIETKGYFHYAFEECGIYYDIEFSSNDTIIKFRDPCGLWVDFHSSLPVYRASSALDSIQNKTITVRGL